jgi:hypothetical protein
MMINKIVDFLKRNKQICQNHQFQVTIKRKKPLFSVMMNKILVLALVQKQSQRKIQQVKKGFLMTMMMMIKDSDLAKKLKNNK